MVEGSGSAKWLDRDSVVSLGVEGGVNNHPRDEGDGWSCLPSKQVFLVSVTRPKEGFLKPQSGL